MNNEDYFEYKYILKSMGNNQTVSKSFNPSLYVRQGITE